MKRNDTKHKQAIKYVAFGVATTCVNFVAFYVMERLQGRLEQSYLYSNVVAWLVAVIFAYVTNKLFVFDSKSWESTVVAKEIPAFFGARVLSLGVEELGLLLCVEKLGFRKLACHLWGFNLTGTLVAKVMLAVVVVVLNYFFSKLVIFKQKTQ